MFLTHLKSNLSKFLGNRLFVWVIAISFFAYAFAFGWRAYIALKHNVGLNEVVTWYGRGYGNLQQYHLSTLIFYSSLWFLGGLGLLLASWIYNRRRPASK